MEKDFLKDLAAGFEFFSILSGDLDNARKMLDENGTQFARRTYLRSFFAFIEGNSFRSRQMALAVHRHRDCCFSNEEIIMLEEKDLSIKDNGDLVARVKYVSLAANIRFSQTCYIKAFGGNQPDYSDNGWAQFKEAIEIRNRTTHPRNKEDLEINDDELTVIFEAKNWYSNNIQFLL